MLLLIREMEPKKILLVEDDNIIREAYQHYFEKSGFSVYTVENGPDAISFAQNQDFDIVVLDIIIPGFDGFHVIEKLKQNEKTAKVPIMILTNLDDEKYVKRATKLGASEYLIKSNTTPEQTVEHIKSLIV